MSTTKENLRRKGRKDSDARIVRLELKDGMGRSRWITADLVDRTENGLGLNVMAPLSTGSTIQVRGKLGDNGAEAVRPATLRWCVDTGKGIFRAGLEFLDQAETAQPQQPASPVSDELDYYEIMQLNPNADPDTITRVYRILAQRYHPDNRETGNPELFVRLCEAYSTLSDPERRAGYDVRHRQTKQLHWKIFDQASVTVGREGEKRKRSGILGLLYAKTLADPEHASINIFELEELLGCPREHLEAALWYLRAKGYVTRSDSGRYAITIQGFDEAETSGAAVPTPRPQIPAHAE